MLRYGTTYAASSAELEKEEIYKRSLVGTNITSNTTGVDRQLLDSWNVHLAKLGSSLYKHRLGLFEQLITIASDSYHSISGGEKLSGFYKAAWLQDEGCLRKVGEDTHGVRDVLYQQDGPDGSSDSDVLYQVLSQHAEAECAAKRSLTGPHRDDVNFTIDGHDARRFASQGQQRSIALALKIAEMEVLRRISGKNPLLLLDDVMSELDTERRAYFIDLIGEASQVVLTTTHLGYFNDDFLRRATVVELTGEGNYKGEGCP
jgi:DNA replication and repair protein RecF